MSRTKKLPAFLAGITASLTTINLAYLLSTKAAGAWIFCLVAAVIGGLLTYHLLEKSGLVGKDMDQ